MKRPRLYAELFAGSFAVGLRLLGARRPPVAYMGAKTSIASQILGVLGLHPGQSADACLLVDAGPWGWAWATLLDPGGRAEVAAILRSWAGEDPHALWMRLAASPPPKFGPGRDGRVPVAAGALGVVHARLVGRRRRPRHAGGGCRSGQPEAASSDSAGTVAHG